MKGGANMVEDEEWFSWEGCNYLKWKINGGAVMQNVNTLLKHVAMEKVFNFILLIYMTQQ